MTIFGKSLLGGLAVASLLAFGPVVRADESVATSNVSADSQLYINVDTNALATIDEAGNITPVVDQGYSQPSDVSTMRWCRWHHRRGCGRWLQNEAGTIAPAVDQGYSQPSDVSTMRWCRWHRHHRWCGRWIQFNEQ
jgi:hypothetical protein